MFYDVLVSFVERWITYCITAINHWGGSDLNKKVGQFYLTINSICKWSIIYTGGKRQSSAIKKGTEKSASNIDTGIIEGTLLFYTTPCFEALTKCFIVQRSV